MWDTDSLDTISSKENETNQQTKNKIPCFKISSETTTTTTKKKMILYFQIAKFKTTDQLESLWRGLTLCNRKLFQRKTLGIHNSGNQSD